MDDLNDFPMDRIYSEKVSPERFLQIYAQDKDNIESAKPLPAKLGSRSLGRILVVWKRPVFLLRNKPISADERR